MKNIYQNLILGLTIVSVLLLFVMPISADIGNAFDDDWGGGFDFGNDYDDGWDNDYDNDYDNDWGNDSNWSDRNAYNSYPDDDWDDSGFLSYSLVPALIIVVFVVILLSRKKNLGQKTGSSAGGMRQQGNPNRPNLYNETVMNEDTVIAKIKENDPEFSAADFKAYVEDCYLKLTEAWEARDWAIARNFESDQLFQIHRRQLEEYIEQKKTNHMDGQCVLSKILTKYENDGKTETVVVKLNATLLDYVTDDATGALLSGSKTQRFNRFYRLEFIRTAGTKTAVDRGLTSHECPCCGAPLNLNATGRCEYCQNVITSGDYTWVLNAYGRWN